MLQHTPYTLPLITVAVLTSIAAYMSWQERPQDGATWFSLVMLAWAPWAVFLLLGVSFVEYEPKLIFISISVIFHVFIAVFWFFFTVAYTGRREHETLPKVVAALLPPIAGVLLVVTPHIHDLVLQNPGLQQGPPATLTYSWGPVFWALAAYSVGIVLWGNYYLLLKFIRSRNIYRKICFFLLVGSTSIVLSGVVSFAGISPFPHLMLVPFTITFSAGLVIASLYSVKFLHLIPVDAVLSRFTSRFGSVVPLARDFVLEEIDNGVVVLDTDDRIVDINSTARQILGSQERIVGRKIQELDRAKQILGDTSDAEPVQEIWIEDHGGDKCYETTVTGIKTDRGGDAGRVILMHDITDRKKREEELDLLKDVMSRFLRHNIRNELNVVNGYAKMIADDVPGYQDELRQIIETTNKVVERSSKTRTIESVLENSGDRVTVNVVNYVEDAVQKVRNQYPDAEIHVHAPDEAYAEVIGHTSTAVMNLVENAVEHNDCEAQVEVTVEALDDWVEIRVEDDGPGIPEHEIEVLREKEETSLRHGSGFGLWLINWIAEKSGGELRFDVENGTTATLRLRKASQQTSQEPDLKTHA